MLILFNYAKVKIDSDDDLPLQKTLSMHMLSYLLSQILIKITTSITITRF